MEIVIQNIRFVYPGCKMLTKEKLYASYGDKEINGSKGKPTHHNLNKHNADRVFEALEQAIKDKIEIDKRDKEAAKPKTIEVVKVEKTEPKKKKKSTKNNK
jgi:hypothetical protein